MATPLMNIPTMPFNTSKKEDIFNSEITCVEDFTNRKTDIDLTAYSSFTLKKKLAVLYGLYNFTNTTGGKSLSFENNISRNVFFKNSGTGNLDIYSSVNASYWRVHFFSAQTNSLFLSIAKIEMADSFGGSNLCVGGTPTSSTNSTAALGAFNGTGWNTTGNYIQGYISYQFTKSVSINEIKITSNNTVATPAYATLQYSLNGTTWYTYDLIDLGTSWSVGQTKTFTVSNRSNQLQTYPHKFWKIYGSASSTGNICYGELTFATTVGGAQAATGGYFLAGSAYNNTFHPYRAFDGVINGMAHHLNGIATNRTFVGYIFPSGIEIAELRITSDTAGGYTNTPTSFEIFSSWDGINWESRLVVTGEPAWTAGITRAYSISPLSSPIMTDFSSQKYTMTPGRISLLQIQKGSIDLIMKDVDESFIELSDSIGTYSGKNYKNIKVNSTGTGLEIGIRHNMSAVTSPTSTDDNNSYYSVGSRWFNSVKKELWICSSNTVGAAKWIRHIPGAAQHGGYKPSTGYFPTNMLNGRTTPGVAVSGRFLFYPFVVYKKTLITSLNTRVVTAGDASSEGKMAIFNNNYSTGLPKDVAIAGSNTSFNTGTLGVKSVAVSYTLDAGIYWACSVFDSPGLFPALLGVSTDHHNIYPICGYANWTVGSVLIGSTGRGHYGYYYDGVYASDNIMTIDSSSLTLTPHSLLGSRTPHIAIGY